MVDTPECVWDTQMAAAAAAEAAGLCALVRASHAAGRFEWAPPPAASGAAASAGAGGMRNPKLAGELFVGGVYVRRFMKDPRFPLRDPRLFAEALAERYLTELGLASGAGAGAGGAADTALLLSAAAVALLRGHGRLADHLAQLGYCQRLLAALAARTSSSAMAASAAPAAAPSGTAPAAAQQPLAQMQAPPDELGGSALRLLHQLSSSSGACEALAACTAPAAVPTLSAAMALWGLGAAALVLESLKRLLMGAGRQREALVAQALSGGLPARLLALLDWHSSAAAAAASEAGVDAMSAAAPAAASGGGSSDAEGAVLRALAVDVLRGLAAGAAEGGGSSGYSAQVAALLASSSVWAAYRDQRHDMFLPSGASTQGGVVGLLTGGEAARFALPPAALIAGEPAAMSAPGAGVAPGEGL